MASKITLEVDDKTAPGLASVDKGLDGVAQSADKAEKELNQAAAAAGKLGDKGPGLKSKLSLTELNQGLEILKKGFQVAAQAVNALAEDGNPAFVELQKSITDAQNALLDIASDPGIHGFASGLAGTIKESLIPAISSIPDLWRSAQDSIADFTASAGEAIGVFAEGTVAGLQEIQAEEAKLLEQAKEANKLATERAAIEGRLEKIQKTLAEQQELQALARQDSETNIRILIDEETEALRELVKQGRATKEEQESRLKRITILQQRLIEIPQQQAEAELKAQAAASQERQKIAEDAVALAQKTEEERVRIAAEADERILQERQTHLAKIKALTEGEPGKAVGAARQALDPRALREQVASQAEDAAFAAGGSKADVRKARIQAFQQFNRGQTDAGAIQSAQDALLQSAVNQAESSGQLGSEVANTFREVVNTQGQAANEMARQAQEIGSLRQALIQLQGGMANNSARQRAQAGGRRG